MMPANVMKGDLFTHPTESNADLLQKQPRRQVTVTGEKKQDHPQGHVGNLTMIYVCHSSCVGVTDLYWLGNKAVWFLVMHRIVSYPVSLSDILEDIPVNEKPVYNFLSFMYNSIMH